ncbi:hypothetical protein HYPSUDRAFT_42679 [Hypholoma sublateritium FD-334 SS-4]|uniref:Uncharacterized protein n=1 Tax=Hypholoma sublateritium (strain FD-334 SS-4) TaxID=945553 RepID=A0A0D2NQ15_HYPSF|nr:hypothetical protein HYPSUDRAFT_42679 [Hypholoma sublateritium FD-334 SS-4]
MERADPTVTTSWNRTLTPIAFISGPLDVDKPYFDTHYIPSIKEAMEKGHNFIVGPSGGVDTLALQYLQRSGVPSSRIRLYFNSNEETRLRPVFRHFEEAGGSVMIVKGGHTERDEAMTRGSHYDILRYRTEEECRAVFGNLYRKRVSGTEKNELRRKSGVGLILPDAVPGSSTKLVSKA